VGGEIKQTNKQTYIVVGKAPYGKWD